MAWRPTQHLIAGKLDNTVPGKVTGWMQFAGVERRSTSSAKGSKTTPPQDYAKYPYIEWYSKENRRVVLELKPGQVQVLGTPIPASESEPVSREEQGRNMAKFLCELAGHVGQ